ncbi:hypothetical protein A0J61_00314 [Choanephora cucurbitarum]|uniref:Uncharacterized protein n=1 Tax=Choanephora cucurbitarum TaxID=101091 RepID=A0A1C7NRM5_9FUNG|nr:hypothetical protein A0J61_00314 [Choanephora cucurbitarum]
MKANSSPLSSRTSHNGSPKRLLSPQRKGEEIERLAAQALLSVSRKRKYTPSPLFSPPRFSRTNTLESDIDKDGPCRWTKRHWQKLEEYYVMRDRDFEKAARVFYLRESLVANDTLTLESDERPKCKELWTKEHILWRAKCLHTSVQYHHGLLPSERKKLKTKA